MKLATILLFPFLPEDDEKFKEDGTKAEYKRKSWQSLMTVLIFYVIFYIAAMMFLPGTEQVVVSFTLIYVIAYIFAKRYHCNNPHSQKIKY